MNSYKEKYVEFDFAGKSYIGKLYNTSRFGATTLMIIMGAFISVFIKAIILRNVSGIEDVGLFSGDMKDSIVYFVFLCGGAFLMEFLTRLVWRSFKFDRNVIVKSGSSIIEHGFVPMTCSQICLGMCFAWIMVFGVAITLLIVTKYSYILGLIMWLSIYLASIFVQWYAMKKIKCKLYIPVEYSNGIIGVKELN